MFEMEIRANGKYKDKPINNKISERVEKKESI